MLKNIFTKRTIGLILLLLFLTCVTFYHTYKPLPKGVSYEGKVHQVENVQFLYDLTYKKGEEIESEKQIFKRIYEVINEAEEFVVIDMFLFNGYYDQGESFPSISDQLAKALINKKKEQPDVEMVFITDEINTTYGSHESEWLEALKAHDIEVIETDVTKLRDSNPLYSSVWRSFIQWFGQDGKGWVSNPFGETAPTITVRSYLKLFNVKANHRKVVATEKSAIISSANPHDASGYHSNIAFEIGGNIIHDVMKSERAVAEFSGTKPFPTSRQAYENKGNINVQLLTEGKIYKHVIKDLSRAKKGDTVWIGMFYLADRKVVEALLQAADNGAKVKLILDPNANAFGQQKIGLPNRPVAAELVEESKGAIDIRWYNTTKEQYHPKTLYIKGEDQSTIISGSANFTKRNLDDLNLETNVKIEGPPSSNVMQEMDRYFERLWNNQNATYTLPFEKYNDTTTPIKKAMYRIQKVLRFTTY
ncbi:phospholipase D family protein [Metabacillus iocasae]|uniref:phospholipase D n=1 Tax=Priestia iocasae TaxID=2291674 RepID=A0ABS2QXP8_9BACI|nr:phosphatidylserine/phosphatidylglycerophosphate/cardiolipin synthase-like enzyme [Metabacillus iocasae]